VLDILAVEKRIVFNFCFFSITKSSRKIAHILITMMFTAPWLPLRSNQVMAQTILSCSVGNNQEIINTAIAEYQQLEDSNLKSVVSNSFKTNLISNSQQKIQVINLGIEDKEGNLVSALGIIASSLIEQFKQQGLKETEANKAAIATISRWAALPVDSTSIELAAAIKESVIKQIGKENQAIITQIPDSQLLTTLAGLQVSSLQALGLRETEIETLSQIKLTPKEEGSFIEQVKQAIALAKLTRPEAKAQLTSFQTQLELELNQIRQKQPAKLTPGSKLRFKFQLANESNKTASIKLPNIQTITENGLTGAGKVTGIIYRLSTAEPEASKTITDTAQDVSIPGGQSLILEVQVEVTALSKEQISAIGIDLQTDCGDRNALQTLSILPDITPDNNELIDPRGEISGCAGEILADYQGFSVALYDLAANDPTQSEPGGITPLTTTELPDDPDNNRPLGIKPNIENSNPFFLTNSDRGKYSFLFDEEKGQLDRGRTYILLVDPGENSIYDQRQIKITIGDRTDRIVQYMATSLDGRPINASDGQTTITGEILLIEDAERVGLNLAVMDLATNICDAQEISITKTGDRATAEPGDLVLYRLAIRNLASVPLTNFQIADTLPAGFRLEPDSVRGESESKLVDITTTQNNSLVNFAVNTTLPSGGIVNLVYAVQVTPNALRGSGENSAIVNAQRTDNRLTVKDGPAIHKLRIEPGILADAGILLGRVFVDKNFDGQQQAGEPGIPNAVIYLEDGNRIITDADGLFSVANVLPGHHTGVLDLTSIPEYRLAPNLRFSEGNSNSRLVNLAPGSTVRMNFAVTPTAVGQEGENKHKVPKSDSE
jgi:uncharacterized repeat protein (TIGR01451 family)